MNKFVSQFLASKKEPSRNIAVLPAPFKPSNAGTKDFQFRPGELTVWAGESGCGKSMLIGQLALSLADQGQKVCFASFETTPYSLFLRLAQQSTGIAPEHFTQELLEEFAKKYRSNLMIDECRGPRGTRLYDKDIFCGIVSRDTEDKGCNQFIFDSLDVGLDFAQKEDRRSAVLELLLRAQEYGVHVHLVVDVHPELYPIDHRYSKECQRELGEIFNIASNVFLLTLLKRNKGFQMEDSWELSLCKNRSDGKSFTSSLRLDKVQMTFRSPELFSNNEN